MRRRGASTEISLISFFLLLINYIVIKLRTWCLRMGYWCQHMRYGDEKGRTAEAGLSAFITNHGKDKYPSDHEVS